METESGLNHLGAARTKEAETDMFNLKPLRHISTLPRADLSSCMLKALRDIAQLDAGKGCSILGN